MDEFSIVTDSDIYAEFEAIWTNLDSLVDEVGIWESDEPDFIELSRFGFCRHQAAEEWNEGHIRTAALYARELLMMRTSEDGVEFSLIALGSLLGFFSKGLIDEQLYRIGYILIPGFLMFKEGETAGEEPA